VCGKKSQRKLSNYRNLIGLREGLSFSDYMDDSVPADVKPAYSLTPMQEDDFPIQAKDQFKGLWEDVVHSGNDYWMDPNGRLLKCKSGHAMWAVEYLMAHNLLRDLSADDPKGALFELGFVRVKVKFDKIYIDYELGRILKNSQWRNLKDTAIESDMQLIDTSGTFKDRTVDVDESVNLSGDKSGKTLFIESMMPENMDEFKSHLAQLFSHLQKELQLKTVPKVKLVSDDKNANKILGKTAYYNPQEKLVVLYITNRHQKDILRSFSHEIIHHWQHENEKLNTSQGESDPKYAQNNPWLRQMEKQAYLLGNILFRDWEDEKKSKDRKSGKKMVEKTLTIGKQYPPKRPNYRG